MFNTICKTSWNHYLKQISEINQKMYFLSKDLRVIMHGHLLSYIMYKEDLFSYHNLWPFAITKLHVQNILS